MIRFQSTRPRGARPLASKLDGGGTAGFNPRARVGRDGSPAIIDGICLCFNPRARVGRDLNILIHSPDCYKFQSTRPRGARLDRLRSIALKIFVSIHAPAWGAT